jgi:DNA polymerase-3 subunit gamma/tau
VTDAALLEASLDAIAAGDSARALRAVEECVTQGRDPGSFAADLERRARELLVVQTLSEVPAELSLTPEADAALAAQAERIGHAVVVRMLELLGEAMEAVRAGADPRTRLELALVKAARPELDGSTVALSARIERLERGATTAGAPAEAGPSRSSSGSSEQAPASGAPAPAPVEQPAAPAEASGQAEDGGDIGSLQAAWPAVVELVRGQSALLGALIEEAEPVAVTRGELTVAFAASAPFLKKKAEDPTNRAVVAAALAEVTGRRWQLSYELQALSVGDRGERRPGSEEEWVRRLMEEFDAEELKDSETWAHLAGGVTAAERDHGPAGSAREGS